MPTPPPSRQELKRQLLRQAVDDNLDTRSGALPGQGAARRGERHGSGRRHAAHSAGGRRWAFLLPFAITALVSVAIGGWVLSEGSPFGRQAPSQAEIGVVLPPMATTADSKAGDGTLPEGAVDDRLFQVPTPIDTDVFPLAVDRIVVDPGHGGEDTGTHGSGLSEKDLTLDIALRLRDALTRDGFEVFLTREDDRPVSLRERAHFANELRADLFVSIHINWIAERSVRGLETYFLGSTDDPFLEELTRRENRDSGYSLSDMKRLLESIYTGARQDESRSLAAEVQQALYESLLRQNPTLKNRGVKTAPFVVLVATEMPAILAEVSCLSNEQEAELLARPLYRGHIAEAMSRGIRRYANEVNQSGST
jgi:N-acetylmuramoyl-L-alanine amidase